MDRYILLFILAICSSLFTAFGKEPSIKEQQANLAKASSLWAEAQSFADNENESGLRKNCKKIITLLKPTDSLYTLSRYVLAELAYDYMDMNEIYSSYAYFNHLESLSAHAGRYSELRDRLKNRYDSLLEEDRKLPITDGIYVAALQSEKFGSYLIVQISQVNNSWESKILGGEAFYNEKMVKKSKTELWQPIYTNEKNEENQKNDFYIMWNKNSQKNPNVELSKNLENSGYQFARNMAGELSSGRYSTSDVITGTLVTGAVRGIFNGLAELCGKGSATIYTTEIAWKPLNGGALDAEFICSKVSQSTYQSEPTKDSFRLQLKLYKLYPHIKAIFIDSKSKKIICSSGITTQDTKKDDDLQWILSTHPLIFDSEMSSLLGIDGKIDLNSLKKNKNYNSLMFNLFTRNGVFQNFHNDSIAARIGPLVDCRTYYYHNQIVYLRNDNTGPFAIIDYDGTEIYKDFSKEKDSTDYVNAYTCNGYKYISHGNSSERRAVINYENGASYIGEVYDFSRSGNGELTMADGKIMRGIFDYNEFVNGDFIIPSATATTTIKYTRYTPDSIAQVSYPNGDLYVGPIDSEYRPHGKGTFTAKGKKPKKTTWENGKMINSKKGLPKKRRNRRSKNNVKK